MLSQRKATVLGMEQSFSALRAKEVIRMCDAECIGYTADILFDMTRGCITALCVTPTAGMSALFSRARITVPWEKVCCIGRQTVLVDIPPEACGDGTVFRRQHGKCK